MVTIDLDISTFYQMANFIVLIFALNYLLYKPIRGILRQRGEAMAQLSSEITSNTAGAAGKAEQLEAELNEARREGVANKEAMKSDGHEREREIVDAATKEMEESVAKVRSEITAEMGKAREELKTQVQAFGQDLAQKILGRSIQ